MVCKECAAYVLEKRHCHRFPRLEEKAPDDWCMEFKAREVIVCPVEEKAKEEKVRVEEKAVASEPEIIVPEVKRGWPKGKPRK